MLFFNGKQSRNVILISIDTLRADHLGCYGYEYDTSPNIDALAEDSAVFFNTYATSTWTLPSHVSLLTSLQTVRHQVYYDDEKMDQDNVTLAEVLRSNHFSTGAFTGGGFVSSAYGFSKGFDSYNEGVGGVFHQDSAERVFTAVSDWLGRHVNRDFFLFIHTYQPHSPYACPFPYKVMFLDEKAKVGNIDLINHLGGKSNIFKNLPDDERRNIIGLYDGEIRYTDEKLIGPLIARLKDLGLYDSTLLIFTSDHGEEFYDHGGWGHGHSLYNELLRVPLIIKFPDSKFRGEKKDNIVSLVDVMPTILEEMKLDFPELDIDGRSLIPVLTGKEKIDRKYIADIGSNVLNSHIPKKISSNIGKTKLIFGDRPGPEDVDFFDFPPPEVGLIELYNLKNDPRERENMVESNVQLANRIIRWINDYYNRAIKSSAGKANVDQRIIEQLKALGYIR